MADSATSKPTIIVVHGHVLDKIGFGIAERANRSAEHRLERTLSNLGTEISRDETRYRRQRLEMISNLGRIKSKQDELMRKSQEQVYTYSDDDKVIETIEECNKLLIIGKTKQASDLSHGVSVFPAKTSQTTRIDGRRKVVTQQCNNQQTATTTLDRGGESTSGHVVSSYKKSLLEHNNVAQNSESRILTNKKYYHPLLRVKRHNSICERVNSTVGLESRLRDHRCHGLAVCTHADGEELSHAVIKGVINDQKGEHNTDSTAPTLREETRINKEIVNTELLDCDDSIADKLQVSPITVKVRNNSLKSKPVRLIHSASSVAKMARSLARNNASLTSSSVGLSSSNIESDALCRDGRDLKLPEVPRHRSILGVVQSDGKLSRSCPTTPITDRTTWTPQREPAKQVYSAKVTRYSAEENRAEFTQTPKYGTRIRNTESQNNNGLCDDVAQTMKSGQTSVVTSDTERAARLSELIRTWSKSSAHVESASEKRRRRYLELLRDLSSTQTLKQMRREEKAMLLRLLCEYQDHLQRRVDNFLCQKSS